MFKLDLPPIFEPVTEQSNAFEKEVVNNKRFVTRVQVGKATTQYGEKNVFTLERGPQMDKDSVMNILKVSKQTLEKFNEKFDWSTRRQASQPKPADGILPMEEEPKDQTAATPATKIPAEETKSQESAKTFSFDKIEF
jgi:hypothetical protein